MVYKKVHKLASRNVDHPSAKYWTQRILVASTNLTASLPMGSRSPMYLRESPLTANGLPLECQLISLNSFCSPPQIVLTTFVPEHILHFILFWLSPFMQFTNLLLCFFHFCIFLLPLCSCFAVSAEKGGSTPRVG